MTIVHDKRHLDPDWERWAKKGLAQESVYSLRFVYLFTQADREKERQMLAGKSDEERVQLETDIVNARDDFMKRVAERVALPGAARLLLFYADIQPFSSAQVASGAV